MSGFESIFKDILSRINTIDRKVKTLETVEYIKFFPIPAQNDYLLNAVAIGSAATYTTGNLRGVSGISTRAKGFVGTIWLNPFPTSQSVIRIYPDDDVSSAYGQQYFWSGGVDTNRQLMSQTLFVPLGSGGGFKLSVIGAAVTVYATAFAYWE